MRKLHFPLIYTEVLACPTACAEAHHSSAGKPVLVVANPHLILMNFYSVRVSPVLIRSPLSGTLPPRASCRVAQPLHFHLLTDVFLCHFYM